MEEEYAFEEKKQFPQTRWRIFSPVTNRHENIMLPAGYYTDQERKTLLRAIIKTKEKRFLEEKARDEYENTDIFLLSKMQEKKREEIDVLRRAIENQRRVNNRRLMGGYNGLSVILHKTEEDRITKLEHDRMADIEKKYDGSRESIEAFRHLYQKMKSIQRLVEIPVRRPGGANNHRGVYITMNGIQ